MMEAHDEENESPEQSSIDAPNGIQHTVIITVEIMKIVMVKADDKRRRVW